MLLTIDSNVVISAYKRDEEFSEDCLTILKQVPENFKLIEPAIALTEIGRALGRHFGPDESKRIVTDLCDMALIVDCGARFCMNAGEKALEYDIYSADALYVETATQYGTKLVTLDDADFLSKLKIRKFDALHVKELV